MEKGNFFKTPPVAPVENARLMIEERHGNGLTSLIGDGEGDAMAKFFASNLKKVSFRKG